MVFIHSRHEERVDGWDGVKRGWGDGMNIKREEGRFGGVSVGLFSMWCGT